MSTLLGSLLGFISSFFPSILKFVQHRHDKAHELKMISLQLDLLKGQHENKLRELETIGNVSEAKYLYKHSEINDSTKWVYNLANTVRPVVTYFFILLYSGLKIFYMTTEQYWKLWGEEDQTIFAAIISFWFGYRAFNKAKK